MNLLRNIYKFIIDHYGTNIKLEDFRTVWKTNTQINNAIYNRISTNSAICDFTQSLPSIAAKVVDVHNPKQHFRRTF